MAQPRAPRIWYCSIKSQDETFVTVYTSEALAREEVARYVRGEWESHMPEEDDDGNPLVMPQDIADAVDQYFEMNDDEHYDIDWTELQGWPENVPWPTIPETPPIDIFNREWPR